MSSSDADAQSSLLNSATERLVHELQESPISLQNIGLVHELQVHQIELELQNADSAPSVMAAGCGPKANREKGRHFCSLWRKPLMPPADEIGSTIRDDEKSKPQLIQEIKKLRQLCDDLDKSAHESTLEEARSSEVILQQQAILDNIPDNVWHKDSEGLYVSVNDPFCKDVGVPPEEIVGKNDYDIFPAEIAAQHEKDSREVMTSGDRTYFEECTVDKEGNTQYLEKVETPIFDDNGDVSGIIGIGHDITSRKKLEIALRHDSTHDVLTGLYNRAFFETELERFARSRMFPMSIVIADVNNLKTVNDTLGHDSGDDLLRLAGKILFGVFRNEDIVARIGGDEFAILLPKTDEKTALQAVERLKLSPQIINGEVSIAVGVAAAENRGQLSEALKLSDERMYRDKSAQKQEKGK